jgi:hypothetical protein
MQILPESYHNKYVNALIDGSNQKIQKAILACLEEYATSENPNMQFPKEIVINLIYAFNDIINGKLPDLCKPKKIKPGKKPPCPVLNQCIQAAITYCLYCKKGLVNDKAYNKTICAEFLVKETTVRTWIKKVSPTIATTIKTKINKKQHYDIINFMRFAGKIYREYPKNRSVSGLNKRQSKR